MANEFQRDESRKDEPQETDSPKRGFLVQIAKYSQLAFVLPAATVAGWLLGAGLDRYGRHGFI